MPRVTAIIMAALAAYAVGTVVGPPALFTLREAATGFSPFMLLSFAVLIASIGYSLGNLHSLIRRNPRQERKGLPYENP